MLQRHRLPGAVLACALLGAAAPAPAATFVIVNADGAGEGFNDTTPAAPVGGNTGTTVGQQRLIAFQRAADIWAARLDSSVPIRVRGQFNPLTCSANSAVLGSAGPDTFFRDFAGAPVANTWYAVALANALAGTDLDPGYDDINATFSSTIGTPGCLESSGWYYGLDGNPPGGLIDFVTVLLHELGHGLGFLTLVDLATGAKALGFNDAYMRHLENHGATPSDYPSMSNAQRVAASIATGNLHWTGVNVRAASGVLSAGKVGDHVRMFAPNPQQPGSSVSHFDTALTPNQLMEPSYTVPLHSPVLELPLFEDIGWSLLTPSTPPTQDFDGDGHADIAWRHNDGKLRVWLLNGAAVQQDLVIKNLATSVDVAGIGDLDGDGKADLVFLDDGGKVSVWLMNGGTIKQSAGIKRVPAGVTIAGIGDLDGDGKADIVLRAADGKVSAWLMDGGSIKQAVNIKGLALDVAVEGAGDIDGDGKADIILRAADGKVSAWLMDGGSIKQAVNIKGLAAAWAVAGIADVDGDGKADLILRRTSGVVSVWAMDGATIKSTIELGALGTNWSILE